MPTYRWHCRNCSHEWDGFAKIAAKDKVSCELCGSPDTFTICGNAGFVLGTKGTVGWADNGYTDNTLGNDPEFKKNFGE